MNMTLSDLRGVMCGIKALCVCLCACVRVCEPPALDIKNLLSTLSNIKKRLHNMNSKKLSAASFFFFLSKILHLFHSASFSDHFSH